MLCFLLLVQVSLVSASDFTLNNLLIKASVHEQETLERTLTLTSGGIDSFQVTLEGLPQASLDQTAFNLITGESALVRLSFDTTSTKPGVYVGSLIVASSTKQERIPVIIEIESTDVFFDLNLDISPQYSEVQPGKKMVAQVKVFDLTSGGVSAGVGPSKVTLDYRVVDSSGTQVSSEVESLVIDKQTVITKSITFPPTLKSGPYILYVVASYRSSVGTASYLFSIRDADTFSFTSFFSPHSTTFTIGIFVLIFFFGLLFFFFFILRDRDALLKELHSYNDAHYHRQKSFVLAQRSSNSSPSFRQRITRQLRHLMYQHRERTKLVRHLKKKGNIAEMRAQLARWKKEYTTTPKPVANVSSAEMQRLLRVWKKEYKH